LTCEIMMYTKWYFRIEKKHGFRYMSLKY
jgi:hypothetical protein